MDWKFRSELVPPLPGDMTRRAERLEISPLLARLLWQRGQYDFEAMKTFLNPSLAGLAPLAQWPGLGEAASLLADGLLRGKRLCGWGDYDVDGITATALV
jgi:single-stranded-DNA-specific exonuclease